MKIPTDYASIFRNRTLIITGVGRSGTSILGKLLGSMEHSYFIYEPAIMKYNAPHALVSMWIEQLRGVLFEDYILPQVQGRFINDNCDDDSWRGNYYHGGWDYSVWWRRKNLSRRREALDFLSGKRNLWEEKRDLKPMYIIKTLESAFVLNALSMTFPECKFICIQRNPNDVINSMVNRGWWTDEHMDSIVDYVDWQEFCTNTYNMPWYISDEDKALWKDWNIYTRTACIVSTLTEEWLRFSNENDACQNIRYEYLCDDPERFAKFLVAMYGLEQTAITERHIKSIKEHKISEYPDITDKVGEPMRERYLALKEELGY